MEFKSYLIIFTNSLRRDDCLEKLSGNEKRVVERKQAGMLQVRIPLTGVSWLAI